MDPRWLVTASIALLACSCGDDPTWPGQDIQYRDEMRSFVQDISDHARQHDPGFIVVAQNGIELLTSNGEPTGSLVTDYIQALSGQGQEDLFYGYDADDEPTPSDSHDWMLQFLVQAEQQNVEVMAIDYCWTQAHVDSSYQLNDGLGFVSFAADHRDLDNIPAYPPEPWEVNSDPVDSLADAHNFLYLINDQNFSSHDQFVSTLAATSYDMFVVDLFCAGRQLDAADVAQLQNKPGGGRRLVLCYMSIGEAEDYRWYWDPEWTSDPSSRPGWLGPENPDWAGNYLVEYWDTEWQAIIFGDSTAYLDRILASGFDGMYLDKIDAYEDWENR
jgi:cysteinyl-tRNA synthetase